MQGKQEGINSKKGTESAFKGYKSSKKTTESPTRGIIRSKKAAESTIEGGKRSITNQEIIRKCKEHVRKTMLKGVWKSGGQAWPGGMRGGTEPPVKSSGRAFIGTLFQRS